MDTSDKADIEFDSAGLCNHCRSFDQQLSELPRTAEGCAKIFRETIARIKKEGTGLPYDSILGISGGVDSAYLAWLARKEGLRPLLVHFDNGWDSEVAAKNVENLVRNLEFDFKSYVVDWSEFRELQLAYLRASVVDVEIPTDHAIGAVLIREALSHGVRFVLSGFNVATEGVLPYSWTYRKSDYTNLRDINRQFGRGTLRTYPSLDARTMRRARRAGIEVVTLLDYVPYVKSDVKRILASEVGWSDYGRKHFESVFTRFYQTYILPQKFGIDKRKAHLSALICSSQLSKAEAILDLESPPDDPARISADRDYVIKKLGIGREEFDEIMRQPIRSHFDFECQGGFFERHGHMEPLRPVWRMVKPLLKAARDRLGNS